MFQTMGDDVLGDDVLGDDDGDDDFAVVGAARRQPARLRAARGSALARLMSGAAKPAWRQQLAPGVPTPGQRLQPLPMTPSANNGVFSAAFTAINFVARPQVPFRTERILASVRRTGAAGITVLAQNIFVGRQLQLVELGGGFDIEFFGPTAFGVRLALDACQPGVEVRISCVTSGVPAGMDTLATSILLLGRSV